MICRNIPRLALITFAMVIMTSMAFAFAANIAVPTTHITNQARLITPNTLKPTSCSAITLTTIVYCPTNGGICDGTNANELILGSPNVDVIQGKGGSDCIVGGGGDDDISGSQASDVCIGGPGTDIFKKCETIIQ
jgi:Ca2+-binding RTX toxin-like protein